MSLPFKGSHMCQARRKLCFFERISLLQGPQSRIRFGSFDSFSIAWRSLRPFWGVWYWQMTKEVPAASSESLPLGQPCLCREIFNYLRLFFWILPGLFPAEVEVAGSLLPFSKNKTLLKPRIYGLFYLLVWAFGCEVPLQDTVLRYFAAKPGYQ